MRYCYHIRCLLFSFTQFVILVNLGLNKSARQVDGHARIRIKTVMLPFSLKSMDELPKKIIGNTGRNPSAAIKRTLLTIPFHMESWQASPHMLPSSHPQSCSFVTRLVGGDCQTLYRPITSPYTARILKPFIRRDRESQPLKLKLLQEIVAYHHRYSYKIDAYMLPTSLAWF